MSVIRAIFMSSSFLFIFLLSGCTKTNYACPFHDSSGACLSEPQTYSNVLSNLSMHSYRRDLPYVVYKNQDHPADLNDLKSIPVKVYRTWINSHFSDSLSSRQGYFIYWVSPMRSVY